MEKEYIIDWMEPKISPTPLWQTFPIKDRNLALPFSQSEMFSEAKSSFHCIEASMASAMRVKNREDEEEWSVKIRKQLYSAGQVHLEYSTIKAALMRIAKTPPSTFGSAHIIEESKLVRNSMTALWTAVYTTIGGVWLSPTRQLDAPTSDASPRVSLWSTLNGPSGSIRSSPRPQRRKLPCYTPSHPRPTHLLLSLLSKCPRLLFYSLRPPLPPRTSPPRVQEITSPFLARNQSLLPPSPPKFPSESFCHTSKFATPAFKMCMAPRLKPN
jgi:hypothetical protein